MHDHDRFRLRFGPYRMPRCKVGGWLTCAVRGRVRVAGIAESRISWPVTKVRGQLLPILVGGLLRAIRRESNQAVGHYWGVSAQTVSKWRRLLDVPEYNEGTAELCRAWFPERIGEDGFAKARAAQHSPERAAKISAAKRGKPRPPEVMAKLRAANRGRKPTEATRQKMREAALRRGAYPPAAGRPFTPEEDVLLGAMTDKAVAEQLGRDQKTIQARRVRLGIPSFRKHAPVSPRRTWTAGDDALLGTRPDPEVAERLGCTPGVVVYRRRTLGVPAYRSLPQV
jgi:hypothetical protein